MTAPRLVLAGTTYLVTRRCAQRQFLLSPSPVLNQLFAFALAHAAAAHAILIHAVCVMSDHYHLVLTDLEGRLPAFCQQLNSLVARGGNAVFGHQESFWAPGSYSALALEDDDTIIAKAVYVLTNPVKDGLVRWGELWPGLRSDPAELGGGGVDIERPRVFFAAGGDVPMAARLTLTAPPGFATTEFRERLVAETDREEERLQEERRRRGRGYLGRERVLRQRPDQHAQRPEPRRDLRPRFAARDDAGRASALARLRLFWVRYRTAWAEWCRGVRDVVFPAGTYLMRVVHDARCETMALAGAA